MSAPLRTHTRARQLWYWISLRMIALALLAALLVGTGMWLRFFWWEARLRERIPEAILDELKRLENDPYTDAERLRQIYGQYLYGDYFTPEVLQADLLWFSLLVLIALPLIVGAGLMLSLRLSRHLDAVAVAARRLAAGDFSARALSCKQVPAALDALMRDVNEMAERLERRERELHASSAAIAHELRTPLTAAKARLQGIMDGIFDRSPQQLSMIMRQLDQLNRLISDLYLLSLVSAGQLALVRSQFQLRPLLEERLAWAAPSLRLLPMSTALYCCEHLPLNADRDRLGQAISILIDNALRYAASGKLLTISAGLHDGQIHIDVEDDGPGFAPEHLELACDRFWRAEHSRSRHAGGSGLGLAVAVAICEAHGGKLSVHNRPAGGARMHLELPAEGTAPQGA